MQRTPATSAAIQPRASEAVPCAVSRASVLAKAPVCTFETSSSSRTSSASRSLSPTTMPAALGSATFPFSLTATRL